MKKHVGMIAGGTGIAPMMQVLREILDNPQDKTIVHLLFVNRHEQDILLKEEIDRLLALHPQQLQVTYVVSQPLSKEWKGERGHLTLDLIHRCMPPPGDQSLIFVCGPPGFVTHVSGKKKIRGVVSGLLKDAGYTRKNLHLTLIYFEFL